jgi:O-antigen/teichoic acid export membrane protein
MLIAGKWLGKELLGFYSVAMHLASLPNQRLGAIINQVAFPAFSRMQHDVARMGTSLLLGIRVLSLTSFAALWGLSSIAPELVSVLLGPAWTPAVVPLQVLGLVMPLRAIANFIPNALQGLGRSDILLGNAIAGALIGPAAFLIGVRWGLLGLSAAWLVATPLIFVQNMARCLPALELRFRQLGMAMLPAAGAGLLMYLAISGVRPVLGTQSGGVRLIALIAAGALTYVAASFVVNRQGLREAHRLFREIVRSKSVKSPSN